MTARTLTVATTLALTTTLLLGGCLEMDLDRWSYDDSEYTYDYEESYWEDYSGEYEYSELALSQPTLSGLIGFVDVDADTDVTAEGYTDGHSLNLSLYGSSESGGSMLLLAHYASGGVDALKPGVYRGYDSGLSVVGCAGPSLETIDLDIEADEVIVDREDHADGSATITVTATFPRYGSDGGEQVLTGSVTTTP